MKSPTVSVVLPVYNAARFLEQTMQSIRRQTLTNIQVICVDDGSTDNSLQILKNHAAEDHRITIVAQANKGAGVARNRGLDEALGEYIWFPDADDFYHPQLLCKAVCTIHQNQSHLAVIGCDFHDEKTRKCYPFPASIRRELLPSGSSFSGHKDVSHDIFSVFAGWAWDKIYHKAFVDENKLRFDDLRTSNDFRFVMGAYIKASSISIVPEVLAHHRRRVRNSLSNTREHSAFCAYEALKNLKNDLVTWGMYNELDIDFRNYAVYFLLWHLNHLKWPAYQSFVFRLKTEMVQELSINTLRADQFHNASHYKELQLIAKAHPHYMKFRSLLLQAYSRLRYSHPL